MLPVLIRDALPLGSHTSDLLISIRQIIILLLKIRNSQGRNYGTLMMKFSETRVD